MNKVVLINNISKALKLLESEKEYAVRTLIEKVTERINYDETLKIENVGVFQLKKEPLTRQERSGLLGSASKEKRTLIYSPPFEELEGNVKSVFLTIDLDELSDTSDADLDKSLSLSVNQPLLTVTQTGEEGPESSPEEQIDSDLERRIINLVEDGKILKDFDIWQEYVNRNLIDEEPEPTYDPENTEIDEMVKKEAQRFEEPPAPEMIEEPEEEESQSEVESEEDSESFTDSVEADEPVDDLAKTILDDDLKAFEEIAQLEGRITTDESEQAAEEEIPKVDEESVPEKEKDDLDKMTEGMLSSDNIDDIVDHVSHGGVEESIQTESEESELSTLDNLTNIDEDYPEEEEEHKSMFDELEDYLKEDDAVEEEQVPVVEEEPEEVDEKMEETKEEVPDETESDEEIETAEVSEEPSTPFYMNKWVIAVATFTVVVVIAVVLLMPGSENNQMPADENTVAADSQQASTGDEELPAPPPKKDSETPTNINEQNKTSTENAGQATERSGLYRKIPNDVQAARQIFYDGQEYTVQISSWRSSKIAEREVTRLRKAGFDAFIYQLYLKSKGSTWNRVRIGYFKTVKEAEDFLAKNKF